MLFPYAPLACCFIFLRLQSYLGQDICSRPMLNSGPMARNGDYTVMTTVANLTCKRNGLHFLVETLSENIAFVCFKSICSSSDQTPTSCSKTFPTESQISMHPQESLKYLLIFLAPLPGCNNIHFTWFYHYPNIIKCLSSVPRPPSNLQFPATLEPVKLRLRPEDNQ